MAAYSNDGYCCHWSVIPTNHWRHQYHFTGVYDILLSYCRTALQSGAGIVWAGRQWAGMLFTFPHSFSFHSDLCVCESHCRTLFSACWLVCETCSGTAAGYAIIMSCDMFSRKSVNMLITCHAELQTVQVDLIAACEKLLWNNLAFIMYDNNNGDFCFFQLLYLPDIQGHTKGICSPLVAFNWHLNRWPWMTLNGHFALKSVLGLACQCHCCLKCERSQTWWR